MSRLRRMLIANALGNNIQRSKVLDINLLDSTKYIDGVMWSITIGSPCIHKATTGFSAWFELIECEPDTYYEIATSNSIIGATYVGICDENGILLQVTSVPPNTTFKTLPNAKYIGIFLQKTVANILNYSSYVTTKISKCILVDYVESWSYPFNVVASNEMPIINTLLYNGYKIGSRYRILMSYSHTTTQYTGGSARLVLLNQGAFAYMTLNGILDALETVNGIFDVGVTAIRTGTMRISFRFSSATMIGTASVSNIKILEVLQ